MRPWALRAKKIRVAPGAKLSHPRKGQASPSLTAEEGGNSLAWPGSKPLKREVPHHSSHSLNRPTQQGHCFTRCCVALALQNRLTCCSTPPPPTTI